MFRNTNNSYMDFPGVFRSKGNSSICQPKQYICFLL